MPPRAGGRGASDDNPLRRALRPVHERLDALEAAIGDINPDYANRTLDYMRELEATTRSHANKVLDCLHNQTTAVNTSIQQAVAAVHGAESAEKRLKDAQVTDIRLMQLPCGLSWEN